MKRKILVGIAFALAGMLLSAFSFTGHAIAEPLRLGVLHAGHSALIYIADSQGFFKKRSVDLVMKEYEAGVTAVNDLIAGNLDAAIATGYVLVRQSFTHPDLRIAASICIASDMEIVVRRDRGIARPQDLKGKRVAVTRGAISEFFLYTYLLFNNIPAASVRVVYLAPSEMVKEMAAGTIDVALLWPPYTDEIGKGLVAKALRWPAQSDQDYYFSVMAKEGFLKTQPALIERFVAALSDADAFIAHNPDRARSILRKRLGADVDWSLYRFQLQLTQDQLVFMELQARWAIRNHLVKKKEMPNVLDFFYFNALDKVKPEAVSIVH